MEQTRTQGHCVASPVSTGTPYSARNAANLSDYNIPLATLQDGILPDPPHSVDTTGQDMAKDPHDQSSVRKTNPHQTHNQASSQTAFTHPSGEYYFDKYCLIPARITISKYKWWRIRATVMCARWLSTSAFSQRQARPGPLGQT